MQNTKQFPSRDALKRFVRHVTGKTQPSALELLEQVKVGVRAAIKEAQAYAKRHKDAKAFSDRLVGVMRAGLLRLEE